MAGPRSSSPLTWLAHEGDPARQVHPLQPAVRGDEVNHGLGTGNDMGPSTGHVPPRLHDLVRGMVLTGAGATGAYASRGENPGGKEM